MNLLIETLHKEPLLFTDDYNNNQDYYFIDNRHDQSIFSVIRKIYKTILIKDETWWYSFGGNETIRIPFWATRIN